MHSNKGVYALLLGSGISAPSGIPTGWNVLMDLIRKIAACEKEKNIEKPEKWFADKFGKEPDYSEVLSKLVKKQTERVALMKPYFEPNEEEKENGLKEPTAAHSAIAKLAKRGYIKVILTTNFDRLLENALAKEGVVPQVINHEDDIEGATPLTHANCTIIKINGDYIDCRFFNTADELSAYSQKWEDYISNVLRDFGLITCGWSGNWDIALTHIIKKTSHQRYNSFFTYKDSYSEAFEKLCNFRKGELLKIKDANHFFTEISDYIEALEDFSTSSPLSKDIAVARIKKYIVKSENRIRLFDLFDEESRRAHTIINKVSNYNITLTSETFDYFWKLHRGAVDMLIPMCVTATQWCDELNEDVIVNVFKKISQAPQKINSYQNAGRSLYYLSSIILLYSVGIACIVFDKYRLLRKVFSIKIMDFIPNKRIALIKRANPIIVDKHELNNAIGQKYYTPLSTFLDKNLKESLITLVGSDKEYEAIFDIFERMLSLNYLWIVDKTYMEDWLPWGEYKWRSYDYSRLENHTWNEFFAKADEMKNEWPPIKNGKMFDGSFDVFSGIRKRADDFLKQIHFG
jgi:hypothetical protein